VHDDPVLDAFDPFDPAFVADPFPTYRRLRDTCPVVHVPHGRGFWFVTRNDLVREAAADPARLSSQVGSLAAVPPSPELIAEMKRLMPPDMVEVPTLLTLDPPGHTRNRRLVSRAFTPPKVRAYEATARAIARELTAGWEAGTVVDFVRAFSVPLPVRVIAIGLAVPDDRVDDFKRWSDNAVAPIGARLSDEQMLDVTRSNVELRAFILEQIATKRARPGSDVLSSLVHARLDDDETSDLVEGTARQLSDDEIVSIVRQLLVAGNETTTNLLTQMLVRFAHEPAWWSRMRDEPTIIPSVVEECLRLVTPSAVNQRRTTCPVDLGGVTIPARADVLISYQSANHDERVFPDPERFDPTRPNLGEHLAFGRGIHFCPGAGLARMEARVALEELTQRVASFEPATDGPLPWNETFQLRAVRHLPLRIIGVT
jgi:cytochrome P450